MCTEFHWRGGGTARLAGTHAADADGRLRDDLAGSAPRPEEVCRETASVLWESGTDMYSAEEADLDGRKVLKASWSRQKDGTVQNGIGYITAVKDTGIVVVQYTYDADTENRYGDKTEKFVKTLVLPE